MLSDVMSHIKLNHLIKKEIVYEGLIHTQSIDATVEMLKNWSGSGEKFTTIRKNKKIQLDFKENLDKMEFNNLLRMVNNMGWFISACLVFRPALDWKKFNYDDFIKNDMSHRLLSFQLEAKYDTELNTYDYNELYHVSPTINKNKILKIGLIPRAKEKKISHPERIYLAENDDIDNISFQFHKLNPNIKLSIFKVNFKELCKQNPSLRLFDDPNFIGGMYTLSNIPPKFIDWEGELDYDVE